MKARKLLSCLVISLGILLSANAVYAHGGGGHGGGGWHGGGWHGGGWGGGGWGGGWGGPWYGGFGPGIIINVPLGNSSQCQIIKQCYSNGNCVRRQVCD